MLLVICNQEPIKQNAIVHLFGFTASKFPTEKDNFVKKAFIHRTKKDPLPIYFVVNTYVTRIVPSFTLMAWCGRTEWRLLSYFGIINHKEARFGFLYSVHLFPRESALDCLPEWVLTVMSQQNC